MKTNGRKAGVSLVMAAEEIKRLAGGSSGATVLIPEPSVQPTYLGDGDSSGPVVDKL